VGILVGTVLATDGDAGSSFQDWTIVSGNISVDGDSDLPFALNPLSGDITVNDSGDLDFSSGTTTFNLILTVSDGVNVSSTETVVINVLQVISGAPEVTISSAANSVTNQNPIPIMVTFTEAVDNFTIDDITLSSGTANNFAGSGATYTFDLIPSENERINIDIDAAVAQGQTSGLDNLAANQFVVEFDDVSPTVTLISTAGQVTNNNPVVISINFSENIESFDVSDISVTGATAANLTGSGTVFTVDVMPSAEGTISISLAENVVEDRGGNGNNASATLSFEFDETNPGVEISSTIGSPTQAAIIPINIVFTEAVQGFDASDIVVTGAALTDFTGTNESYTANLRPSEGGIVTVDIASGVAADLAGNGNTAASQFMIEFQASPPTVIIFSSQSSPTNANPIPISIVFSEDVNGFELSDINIAGGSIGNLTGTGGSYTAEVTPSADGRIAIMIPGEVAQSNAGFGNLPSEQFEIDFDGTSPTVVVERVNDDPVDGPFDIIITFSEPVNGFGFNDLEISNVNVSNFSGVGTTYNATLTPTNSSDITISIAAEVAMDLAGNLNLASNVLTVVTEVVTSIDLEISDEIDLWVADNIMTITIENNRQDYTAQIFTLNGEVIDNFNINTERVQYDLNSISSGVYILRLESPKALFVKKVFVR
ncbi:MAG: Ig-like domain-containing protein, partial [Bacteroidota bacterium]